MLGSLSPLLDLAREGSLLSDLAKSMLAPRPEPEPAAPAPEPEPTLRERTAAVLRERRRTLALEKALDHARWAAAYREHAYPEEYRPLGREWDELVTLPGAAITRAAPTERSRELARLRGTPKCCWTGDDWELAGETVRAIRGVLDAGGALHDEAGRPTGRHRALLALGHDPGQVEAREFERLIPVMKAMPFAPGSADDGLLAHMTERHGGVPEGHGRLLHIVPTVEGVDIQHQVMTLDALRESWPYYSTCGNIDLEHLSKQGHPEGEGRKRILRAGFPYHPAVGKVFYEVGRPIPGTFDPEDCSFLARVYEDKPDADSAANWYWSTARSRPWRASVGGFASTPVPAIVHNRDPRLNLDRTQLVGVVKTWRWNNVALTLEAVNHHVPPVNALARPQD